MRTDDSVVRASARAPRRCRCAARAATCPASIDLPLAAARPVLACGAELKSTFCVAKGARAWVGHHIGDLRQLRDAALLPRGDRALRARCSRSRRRSSRTTCTPTTSRPRYALEREGVEHVAVQHHHAHLAACLAEHGETGPAVGAIFDGSGLGTDGTVWGGELLVGDLRRLRARRPPAPGAPARRRPRGPRAVADGVRVARRGARHRRRRGRPRSPARVDAGALARGRARWRARGVEGAGDDERRAPVRRRRRALRAARDASPTRARRRSSSRRAPTRHERGAYPLPVGADRVLDARPTILAVAADAAAGVPPASISARFHRALAAGDGARAGARRGRRTGIDLAVLSGGVFQNRAAARGDGGRGRARRAARARPRARAAQRRRHRLRPGGDRRRAT